MKIYFKGGAGIENPVDFRGDEIKDGDILSANVGDWKSYSKVDLSDRLEVPVFRVIKTQYGFHAEGISQKLYLHDFRFKYSKIIKNNGNTNK